MCATWGVDVDGGVVGAWAGERSSLGTSTCRSGSEPGRLRILVLGPLVVEHDNAEIHVAGSRRRRLLAFLATRSGQVAGADAIAEALWGDDLPCTATKTIHNHVARLRGSFASIDRELIETTPGGYRLMVDPETIDAVVFERLAGEGRRRLRLWRRRRRGQCVRRRPRAVARRRLRRVRRRRVRGRRGCPPDRAEMGGDGGFRRSATGGRQLRSW